MTAEIVLLNKHGVALAADSAITFTTHKGQKVRNTGSKLFTLSKRHPGGVMVYGNAEYMGVPWETIIKIYREQLADRCFDRLADYFNDFIGFLGSDDELFDSDAQAEYVFGRVLTEFMRLRRAILDKWDEAITAHGEIDEKDARKIARDEIRAHLRRLSGRAYATGFDGKAGQAIADRYAEVFVQARDAAFQELTLSSASKTHLAGIAVLALTRDRFFGGTSGVVVAGFGRRDHFPAVAAATVEGRVAGRLRYARDEGKTHTVGTGGYSAAVVSFAQTDVVHEGAGAAARGRVVAALADRRAAPHRDGARTTRRALPREARLGARPLASDRAVAPESAQAHARRAPLPAGWPTAAHVRQTRDELKPAHGVT